MIMINYECKAVYKLDTAILIWALFFAKAKQWENLLHSSCRCTSGGNGYLLLLQQCHPYRPWISGWTASCWKTQRWHQWNLENSEFLWKPSSLNSFESCSAYHNFRPLALQQCHWSQAGVQGDQVCLSHEFWKLTTKTIESVWSC